MPKIRLSRRKRRSLHEVSILMDEFHSSGMTAAQFARRMGVSVATVYQWRRRVREKASAQTAGASSFPSMVRIIPTADEAEALPGEPKPDSGVSVVLPSGLLCRVEPGFHEPTLLRVVQLLAY